MCLPVLSSMYNNVNSYQRKTEEREDKRGFVLETKKTKKKTQKCFDACPDQGPTSSGPTDHGDRDGSGWNVPEIRCAALHTDPRQVSPETHRR